VEVIAIATEILQKLGLKNLSLQLNSVGNGSDRQTYREALVSYLTPFKADLDKDSQDRLDRNPMRILDSKDPKTQEIAQNAPSILDYLGDDSKKHFDQVQASLTALGIEYHLNPCLVRGLDYYTHTAFEIQSSDLGAQATVCGGGRYDGLVSELGGPETPAVGWAIGLERLVILLQQLQELPAPQLDFYLVSKGEQAEAASVILAHKLRFAGFSVELDLSGSAFGKQFKRADRSGAIACLVIGDEEAENNQVQLKWLQTKEQQTLTQAELLGNIEQWRQKIQTLKD
jgi:histidyl-tRNA synthetase